MHRRVRHTLDENKGGQMITTNENGTSGHLPFDEELCERYLFGELSEAEQERFEKAYFSDDSFFNKFLAVKDEVLDLYSRNELDHEKRRRMEPHFLASGSRKKHLTDSRDFINSITVIAERSAERETKLAVVEQKSAGLIHVVRSIFSPLRFASAAGLILVLAVSLWILVKRDTAENIAGSVPLPPGPSETTSGSDVPLETSVADGNAQIPAQQQEADPRRPSQPADQLEIAADGDRADPANTTAPLPGLSPTPPSSQIVRIDPPETKPPDIANKAVQVPTPDIPNKPDPKQEIAGVRTESVTLDSATRSATKRNTAQIGSATQSVEIRMVFGGEAYSSYSVRVSGVGGGPNWRGSNLKTRMNEGAKSLTVTVPASYFTRKDYIVVLEGRVQDGTTETIREYYLRVDRQLP